MNTYTYSEARQKLATLLEKAKKEGKVIITRKDGSVFELKAILKKRSPLDVKGINIRINSDEIIDIIKEVRQRGWEVWIEKIEYRISKVEYRRYNIKCIIANW